MFESMKNVFKRELTKKEIIDFIFSREEHLWMTQDQYVFANLTDFFERVPKKALEKVFIFESTIFALASGKYACSVGSAYNHIVLIFPETYKLLTKTYDGWAKAVLAHEIGHIYLDHSKLKVDPMEAQVDADEFACEIGYLDQIEDFLHDQPESVEKRVRLTFITNYYFAKNPHAMGEC